MSASGAAEGAPPNDTLTRVPGFAVGHWTDAVGATGCTVVLAPPEGAVASGFSLGPAPATRELVLLEPERLVQRAHAVLLTGGSAFGLAAADGVMRWLEERGRGIETPGGRVPIVPAAAIWDLWPGERGRRPGAEGGYAACEAADRSPVAHGSVGAGTGALAAQRKGLEHAPPGGLGSASRRVDGATVGVLAVCNPGGEVFDPADGSLVAGSANPDPAKGGAMERPYLEPGANTTLLLVATDAPLAKGEARLLAQAALIGLARAVRPLTPFDGDTAFALSSGSGPEVPLLALHVAAQELAVEAILRGVRAAGRDRPA